MQDPFALVNTMYRTKWASHDTDAAIISRMRHPDSGWCLRCGRAWPDVNYHTMRYEDGSSIFPTCEDCWKASERLEKIIYCRALFRGWRMGALHAAWSANVKEFEDHSEWLKILKALKKEPVSVGERLERCETLVSFKTGNPKELRVVTIRPIPGDEIHPGVVCMGEPTESGDHVVVKLDPPTK